MNVGVRHWICKLKQNPWSPWAHHVCTVNKQVPVFCHRNIDPACRSNAGWRRELGKRLEDPTLVKPGSPGQGVWLQTQLIAEKHPPPQPQLLLPIDREVAEGSLQKWKHFQISLLTFCLWIQLRWHKATFEARCLGSLAPRSVFLLGPIIVGF